ncbi:MAG: hypothetical protein AUH43_05410 [Acidobacteria bacterium 13_1_40CM_65_14]|nr:MAG: hypothetical protein AUH43_05410 [Acidobacteria bacterium 13_1_40CM_65_14]
MVVRMTRSHVIRGGAKSIAGRGANAGGVGAVWTTFLGPQPARPNPASAMPPVLKKFRLSMLFLLGRTPLRACYRLFLVGGVFDPLR